MITAYDVIVDSAVLNINTRSTGMIETPFSVDRWTFAAASGVQVRFDLINRAGSTTLFELIGPNGYVGFNGQSDDSGVDHVARNR